METVSVIFCGLWETVDEECWTLGDLSSRVLTKPAFRSFTLKHIRFSHQCSLAVVTLIIEVGFLVRMNTC